MRNVFDQYNQPENRLTHALLSSLAADQALLRRFVRDWASRRPNGKRLKVFEQSLPGDALELSEEEAERKGLPDGCIIDGQGWALLIESKLAAPLKADQLRRHVRTANRRGLGDCQVLAITLDGQARSRSASRLARRWSQVYEWLARQSKSSSWARRCAEYLEALEASLPSEYLMKGTLTVFSGIPFGADEPYNYSQAKRLLGLLRDELLGDRRLKTKLCIDPKNTGRGAITGRQADSVWDFVGLEESRRAGIFTQYPHLTVGIHADRVDAYVTVPNGIKSRFRAALLGSEYVEFERTIYKVTRGIDSALRRIKGAAPMIVIVQRHYPSQREIPVHDSLLRFDPRTAMRSARGHAKSVKFQPQWLRATYEALLARRSNLQFQIGAQFPYATCPVVRTRQLVQAIANVWLACRPVVEATAGRRL